MRRRLVFLVIQLASTATLAAPDACVEPAAIYHEVSAPVLRAILTVESGMRAGAINKNANGSIDVGIGQINSIHFRSLRGWGITPENLLDACVGTYVSAWHLKKQMLAYGNTWFAVGAYHSVTPSFNLRYQKLIYAQLGKAGATRRQRGEARLEAATAHDNLPYIGAVN